MLDQARSSFSGGLWLTNETLAFGDYAKIKLSVNAFIELIVDELVLGDTPAIIYDPSVDGGEMRYYELGLGDLGSVIVYPVAHAQGPTYEAVEQVINMVHEQALITPQQQVTRVSTWQNAEKSWASANAEAVVQSVLRPALMVAFLHCQVEQEQTVASGRFDLTVVSMDPVTRAKTTHGVIELKILKSHGSSGASVADSATVGVVHDGFVQAHSYKDDLNAIWAVLACFDMRRIEQATDACFDKIRAEAVSRGVHLGRWQLYASSKEFRETRSLSGAR